jgi:ribosomal protein S18 acetylase RimI-like enzyme
MDDTNTAIRPFAPADLTALQEIRRAAFAPVFASFRSLVGADIAEVAFAQADAEQAQLLAGLCEPHGKDHVFVAEHDGTLAGFVTYSLDEKTKVGEIGLNAVHPDFGGRGIGTRLVDFAVRQMREAGMLVASVGTGGDDSHAPARRAYEKAGFGPSIPSVWMYRRL